MFSSIPVQLLWYIHVLISTCNKKCQNFIKIFNSNRDLVSLTIIACIHDFTKVPIIDLSPFITLIHNCCQSYLSLIPRNNCNPFAALSKLKAWWTLCVAVWNYGRKRPVMWCQRITICTCRYANDIVCLIVYKNNAPNSGRNCRLVKWSRKTS